MTTAETGRMLRHEARVWEAELALERCERVLHCPPPQGTPESLTWDLVFDDMLLMWAECHAMLVGLSSQRE